MAAEGGGVALPSDPFNARHVREAGNEQVELFLFGATPTRVSASPQEEADRRERAARATERAARAEWERSSKTRPPPPDRAQSGLGTSCSISDRGLPARRPKSAASSRLRGALHSSRAPGVKQMAVMADLDMRVVSHQETFHVRFAQQEATRPGSARCGAPLRPQSAARSKSVGRAGMEKSIFGGSFVHPVELGSDAFDRLPRRPQHPPSPWVMDNGHGRLGHHYYMTNSVRAMPRSRSVPKQQEALRQDSVRRGGSEDVQAQRCASPQMGVSSSRGWRPLPTGSPVPGSSYDGVGHGRAGLAAVAAAAAQQSHARESGVARYNSGAVPRVQRRAPSSFTSLLHSQPSPSSRRPAAIADKYNDSGGGGYYGGNRELQESKPHPGVARSRSAYWRQGGSARATRTPLS
eukprot:jgi/Tetstr1/460158/TSEL_005474.t1